MSQSAIPPPDDPLPGEVWRPCRSWAWYEVSSKGRVRSLGRMVMHSRGGMMWRAGRILKGSIGSHGYRAYGLSREDGPPEKVLAHELVLEEFAGPRPPGQQARHGPAGKLDNRWPESLCWGTPAENAADKIRDGTLMRGEAVPQAKLSAAQVAEMRARHAAGEASRVEIAAEYDISRSQATSIINGKCWSEGYDPGPAGERRGPAKLTAAQAAEIRARFATGGIRRRALADEYGISKSQMGRIIRGESWREPA